MADNGCTVSLSGSKQGNRFSAEKDEWGADHMSEIHIEGRIVLNLWRVLRHEVSTRCLCLSLELHCLQRSFVRQKIEELVSVL